VRTGDFLLEKKKPSHGRRPRGPGWAGKRKGGQRGAEAKGTGAQGPEWSVEGRNKRRGRGPLTAAELMGGGSRGGSGETRHAVRGMEWRA